MVNTVISASFNLYTQYPRSNRKYIKENKSVLDLVPFGINLTSTVGYPRYTIIVQHMVVLPNYINEVIVGLLLSDGWMQKQNLKGHARLSLKQSLVRSEYLLYVFFILSHYCKSYPFLGYTKLNNKTFPFLTFSTRSLTCFTEIFDAFYVNGKKVVPEDIYNLLTIQGLAH